MVSITLYSELRCVLNPEMGAAALPRLVDPVVSEVPPSDITSFSQQTLFGKVTISGIGLFTGEKTSITICPAEADTGIVFVRVDLPGAPEIPARLPFVREALRCTCLANGNAKVLMVEHLLSALFGMGIHNARIEVKGSEIPSGDGSSQIFVDALETACLKTLKVPVKPLIVKDPLFWSDGTIHLVALPAPSFSLSYTLHYPRSQVLGSQYFTYLHSKEQYKLELAPCRTFSLYEEIAPFLEKGLIKGGGLENALVIKGDRILNPEGARFPNEMVRHKMLDLIGDLSLIGRPLLAHVIAICSGHASNCAFAKILSTALQGGDFHGE